MDNAVMNQDSIYTKDRLSGPNYKIGSFTYGVPKVYDWNEGTKLIIGKYTSIAEGVTILLGGNHRIDWVTTYPFPAFKKTWKIEAKIEGHPWSKGDVTIGNDVWVGYGVTILSGVTIGDGAVVAAGSLVTKNIPPYTIWGGNPAKLIRRRFSRRRIKNLIKLKWWDWPESKIRSNIELFCSTDIQKFIKKGKK